MSDRLRDELIARKHSAKSQDALEDDNERLEAQVRGLEGKLPGKLKGERALADEQIRCFLDRAEKAEAKLAQAEQRRKNIQTLLAVLCGHSPGEPLFALIDEVEVVRQRVAELSEQLLAERQTQAADGLALRQRVKELEVR